jgi:hypothetical protein
MVEWNGKEDQQRFSYKLKSTSVGDKQGLWKKTMCCKW